MYGVGVGGVRLIGQFFRANIFVEFVHLNIIFSDSIREGLHLPLVP